MDRLTRYRSFVTNGSTSTKDDASDYEYDALDRVLEQTESHGATGSPRTTLMTYLGLGNQVSGETQHNGADGSAPLLTTKNHAYDTYGHRISMTNTPTVTTPYEGAVDRVAGIRIDGGGPRARRRSAACLTGPRGVRHHRAMVRLGSSMAMPGRPRSGRS